MKEIEWTETALNDMKALEAPIMKRIRLAIERFTSSGAGNIRKMQGIEPPEYRLRVGDYRVRFELAVKTIRILRVRHRREIYR